MQKDVSKAIVRSLSKIQAMQNLDLLDGSVTYDLSLVFSEENIAGNLIMTLTSKRAGDFYLSYRRGKLTSLIVNGEEIHEPDFNGEVLTIKSAIAGELKVSVSFESSYSKSYGDGAVLLSGEQGEKYLYTMLETVGASRIFPCFDQPSVRGIYQLQVMYPKAWGKAWSNGQVSLTTAQSTSGKAACSCCRHSGGVRTEASMVDAQGNTAEMVLTKFTPSEPLPAYLFCIFIGNYHEIDMSQGGLEQVYLCMPQAKTKLEESVEIMARATSHALTFFENYLDCKYPFKKYNYIFVPSEFTPCMADEIPGIVLVDEAFLEKRSGFYFTKWIFILCHEMAHMWFGNLVAIKFWNEVWLKETFADLLGLLCFEHLAYLQRDEGLDMGLPEDPLTAVHLIKCKRRLSGFNNTHEMIVCGKCRPLIKTDIDYQDEAVSCYGDDAYGSSLFDVHQFMSVYPACLQDVTRSVIKRFAWTFIDSDDFLDLVLHNDKLAAVVSPEDVRKTFHSFFREVGLTKIQVQVVEGGGLEFSGLEGVDRWGSFKVLRSGGSGEETEVRIGKLCKADKVEVAGTNLVIDADFFANVQLDLNFDAYVGQLTDDCLRFNALLVFSQVHQSRASLDQQTFDRLCKAMVQSHWKTSGYWMDKIIEYAKGKSLNTEHLDSALDRVSEEFFKSKFVEIDYLLIFTNQARFTEPAFAKQVASKIISLLENDETQRHFDFLFARSYFLEILIQGGDYLEPDLKKLLVQALSLVCLPTMAKKFLSLLDPSVDLEAMFFNNLVTEALEFMHANPTLALGEASVERIRQSGGNTIFF